MTFKKVTNCMSADEEKQMQSKFCAKNNCSREQEQKLCDIQNAVRYSETDFLDCLPIEVVECAKKADAAWFGEEDGDAIDLDKELLSLVKKYWNKKGIAISQ